MSKRLARHLHSKSAQRFQRDANDARTRADLVRKAVLDLNVGPEEATDDV
jgi:hypothetical protein